LEFVAAAVFSNYNMAMEGLILFDIDGTLTRSQNGYIPFNEALLKTFGIEGDIRTVVPDGNTDPRIVEDIFRTANIEMEISQAQWAQFEANLRSSYRHSVQRGTTTVRALPGTLDLLKTLSAHGSFYQGIVTGNFEVTARIKLETAGLNSYLGLGAFAGDSSHRPDLPAIAKTRWELSLGKSIQAEQCVIIGDTPNDLEAARHNHMKCILVGTGRYPLEELMYWHPDAYLPDLSDTALVLNTIMSL
jgi:phosphoglycolate phosphatase-like HAD superfamily hydrolase